MVRNYLSVLLVGAGCWLCWCAMIMAQDLSLPWWLPLSLTTLLVASATVLCHGRMIGVVGAAVAGTFAGTASGFAIWTPRDGIAASYIGLAIVAATLECLLVALATAWLARALLARSAAAQTKSAVRILWLILSCCASAGPVGLVVTPSILAHRLAANDRQATLRFESLKQAVEQAFVEGGPQSICDGKNIQKHYAGPPFRDKDWTYISGNYVQEDGYVFGVYCNQQDGYALDASPKRGDVDGTRQFCTDESRAIGCRLEWKGSREHCVPCPK